MLSNKAGDIIAILQEHCKHYTEKELIVLDEFYRQQSKMFREEQSEHAMNIVAAACADLYIAPQLPNVFYVYLSECIVLLQKQKR